MGIKNLANKSVKQVLAFTTQFALLMLLGYCIARATTEPQVISEVEQITHYVEVEKLVELPPEVEYIYEVVIETEIVEVEVPQELREFDSVAELEQWRDDNLVVEIKGVKYRLPTEQYSEEYDCDDIAEAWQRELLADGYLASSQVIWHGELLGVKVSESENPHDGIRVNIGNDVYYLDTFAPYGVTRVVGRD